MKKNKRKTINKENAIWKYFKTKTKKNIVLLIVSLGVTVSLSDRDEHAGLARSDAAATCGALTATTGTATKSRAMFLAVGGVKDSQMSHHKESKQVAYAEDLM